MIAGCFVLTAFCRSTMSFTSGSIAFFGTSAVTSLVNERVNHTDRQLDVRSCDQGFELRGGDLDDPSILH